MQLREEEDEGQVICTTTGSFLLPISLSLRVSILLSVYLFVCLRIYANSCVSIALSVSVFKLCMYLCFSLLTPHFISDCNYC